MENDIYTPSSGAQAPPHCAAFQAKSIVEETIYLYNWVGLHGTLIVARMYYDLLVRRFNKRFIERLFTLEPLLRRTQAVAAAISSEASLLLTPRQDGIFASLWQLSSMTRLGLDVDLLKLPIRQETVEICDFFDINPYELDTQGCLILVAKHPQQLCDRLLQAVPPAVEAAPLSASLETLGAPPLSAPLTAVGAAPLSAPLAAVGTLTPQQTKILRRRDGIQYLNRPSPNALYRIVCTHPL
ncbi:MAG: hypothetical protein LBM60_05405 [Clostridium sp.]|jgi:hypothetical protein|nr:hypothetical protein [Clostridium sp.]